MSQLPLTWTKSSHSYGVGECVEFAQLPDGMVGVRDSKDPSGAVLTFTKAEIRAFLLGVHDGEFDAFGQA